jgi:hypothetical protein
MTENRIGVHRIIGPTILLRGGTYFDFENPAGSVFTIYDVAHSLSMICRFNGHVRHFYSVAEHSLHCSYLVPQEHALQALLHDSAEAFLGDMSRPLKTMMPEYKALERKIEAVVLPRLGIPAELPQCVKDADAKMLRIEQQQAMDNRDDWSGNSVIDTRDSIVLQFLSPARARKAFLDRYTRLTIDLGAA